MWAEQGWLEEVGEAAAADPSYNLDDIFDSMKAGLSYDGGLYALPFYGESAMTFYRKDLFDAAGIEMPERPTWDQIAEFAAKLNKPGEVAGVCLRGLPGLGRDGCPTWAPSSMPSVAAGTTKTGSPSSTTPSPPLRFVSTSRRLQKYGPEGVTGNGFTESETLAHPGQVRAVVRRHVGGGADHRPEDESRLRADRIRLRAVEEAADRQLALELELRHGRQFRRQGRRSRLHEMGDVDRLRRRHRGS